MHPSVYEGKELVQWSTTRTKATLCSLSPMFKHQTISSLASWQAFPGRLRSVIPWQLKTNLASQRYCGMPATININNIQNLKGTQESPSTLGLMSLWSCVTTPATSAAVISESSTNSPVSAHITEVGLRRSSILCFAWWCPQMRSAALTLYCTKINRVHATCHVLSHLLSCGSCGRVL